MSFFDNYLNELNNVLSKKVDITTSFLNEQRDFSKENFGSALGSINENYEGKPSVIEGPKVLFKYDPAFIERYFGKNAHSFQEISIGMHPDFIDIKESGYLNHYCVSVFIDIKGSTKLIEKYSLLEVRLIKDSLLTLAIQVANQFGGHVHRLQGDGIFLQFVRRNQHCNDAIINALNTSSILAQFVTKDLASIMEQNRIEALKIRVGIDYGSDLDVLWSYYGIPGCGELTTTSLHTDMAAKLQAIAPNNSILIGNNIKNSLDLKESFYGFHQDRNGISKTYNVSSSLLYPFFVFNWKEYLSSLPFFYKDSNGASLSVKDKSISIECFIGSEVDSVEERYYPNSRSIPKNWKIKYVLKRGASNYVMGNFEKIEWRAFNSGKEANEANMLNHDFNKYYNNNPICETSAAFLGHHYVECRIIRANSPVEKLVFPIFVG